MEDVLSLGRIQNESIRRWKWNDEIKIFIKEKLNFRKRGFSSTSYSSVRLYFPRSLAVPNERSVRKEKKRLKSVLRKKKSDEDFLLRFALTQPGTQRKHHDAGHDD